MAGAFPSTSGSPAPSDLPPPPGTPLSRAPEPPPGPLRQLPRDLLRDALTCYLDLHAHPELSGAEERTAGRLAERLERAGCTVTTGIGGHGVVGVLRNGDGPTVWLRAELDALPVQERTGLPYASTVPGVAHACGHDLHVAAVVGATAVLAQCRDRWRGTLVVLGQPAEETLAGARALLVDGLYRRFPAPDAILAQHCAPLPAGTVAHSAGGPVLAGSVTLDVVVHGTGGHAGTPHLTVDPVVTAAAVVMRLQTVVSRETAPAEPVALTVGSLHAGQRGNVVPDRAELGLTVRAFSPATLDRVTAAVRRVVTAECLASGCPRDPEITVTSHSPVLDPDPGATAAVRGAHLALLGADRVRAWAPGMASEDFPWFADPGEALHGVTGVRPVYWMLGTVDAQRWRAARDAERDGGGAGPGLPANHAPDFAPAVRTALPTGITAMAGAALCQFGEEHRAR